MKYDIPNDKEEMFDDYLNEVNALTLTFGKEE
jgi:hypothetical protein